MRGFLFYSGRNNGILYVVRKITENDGLMNARQGEETC